jgi:hypothetical protein
MRIDFNLLRKHTFVVVPLLQVIKHYAMEAFGGPRFVDLSTDWW